MCVCMVITTEKNVCFPLSPSAPENLVSRDGFDFPSHVSLLMLHTPAESGTYLRDSSRFPRRRPFIYLNRHYAVESVPSLSGHAIIAYRWSSLPNKVDMLKVSKEF